MGILVVDDSKAMRMIVRRTLRMAGFHNDVTEASSAGEALNLVKAGGVELILSDWNMPEMTGIQFLEKLRAEGNTTRFGFVTSECSPDAVEAAKQAGALFVITKPFTADALQSHLGPILG